MDEITSCDVCGKKIIVFFDIPPEDGDYTVLCDDCWEEGIRPPLPIFIGLPVQ